MAASAGVLLLRRAGRPRTDSRRAQHLGRSPDPTPPSPAAAGAFRSPRPPARASAAGATRPARHAATARGRGRSRAARSRSRDRVARRRPRSPSPRSVATDTNRHLCCGRDGRDSSCRAGARIQHSAGRCPSAPGSRALDAPLARAPELARHECERPAAAPRSRAIDGAARRERPELERLARVLRRVEPEGQPRQTEELAPRRALVVRHESEPVRARRPRVLR